jgi:sugar lactone lactonase YvrE
MPMLLLALATAPDSARAVVVDSTAVVTESSAARVDSTARDSTARDSTALPLRGRWVATLAANTVGPGRVVEPSGIATDAFGRVYVSDAALHRVQRYDAQGRWLGESGSLGSGPGELRRPGALAAVGTLSLAVLDRENRRVLSYDLFGRLQGTLIDFEDPALVDALGRTEPIGFGADRGGGLYVAEADRDRLLAFDSSGRFLRTVGGYGARPGSFHGLAGLALGPHGEIWVTERVNARAQRLDSGGRVRASFALPVSPARGSLPVAADDSGRVAIADEASGRLWIFDGEGVPLAEIRGLDGVRALAFARDGTLLVAEAGAGRVRRLVLERNLAIRGRRGE